MTDSMSFNFNVRNYSVSWAIDRKIDMEIFIVIFMLHRGIE
ncbi:hypothetical protein APHNP_0172 [Anaplasma phagocytophilum str. ApNP]|uniref:Uncharacterized protein n=1 Tax=Anaplasma phagocytophilum str. ApNP TaxID=1359153 RepID=A0A0F3NHT6_ANAPH|nr:hypothetical protein APHNP_0172 [Anaplasma phagocytophilum str. ApNP]